MQVAGKAAKEVATGLAGAKGGDTYTGISYGNDLPCRYCGNRHPLYETQIVYEVCRNLIKLLPEQDPVPSPMMIGVLRSNNDIFYAGCSPADGMPGQVAFDKAIKAGRTKLPPITLVGNLPLRKTPTRSGNLPADKQLHGGRSPYCRPLCRPKLIHVATTQAAPRPWRMSEVWFDPLQQNATFTHLDTAESCQTCRNLLPLLLCKQGPGVDLVSFTGLIRTQWPGF